MCVCVFGFVSVSAFGARPAEPIGMKLGRLDGNWIFNVLTNLGVCRTHEGGSEMNKSAQVLTQGDRETVLHPAPPMDQTQGLRV